MAPTLARKILLQRIDEQMNARSLAEREEALQLLHVMMVDSETYIGGYLSPLPVLLSTAESR